MTRDPEDERASVVVPSVFVLPWALLLSALHLAYGQQFPAPWNDEVHFLIPSANVAPANESNAPQMLNGQDERPLPEPLLRGYACASIESLISPGKLYVIDVRSFAADREVAALPGLPGADSAMASRAD